MSRPAKVRLQLLQGQTYHQVFTWRAGTPPAPVDLTGCSALMHVRASVGAPAVLLELSTTNGRIALGGEAGTITLALSAAETAALTFASAVYDLEITHPGGQVRRLLQGAVAVSPEVTR